MSRPKLSSPSQPPLVRWALRLYEFCASLSLAVILISSSAFALGLATFVEAAYGTPVVQFYVYQTWWFSLILVFLAINIFCAAAIRYPWKRHQTGFVITHIGLLTLLLGAFIGRYRGIDAQVSVFEGQSDKWAIENAVKLLLTVNRAGESSKPSSQQREVTFHPGLFNWEDWNEQFAFSKPEDEDIPFGRWSWQLFRSGCGQLFSLSRQNWSGDVLYNKDGVKLQVLDYLADAEPANAPYVKFHVRMPSQARSTAEGVKTEESGVWVPTTLSVRALPDQPEYPNGWSEREFKGGGAFTMQLAGSDAQTESFLKSLPEGKLGSKGQAVIFVDGQPTRISIDEAINKKPVPLGGGYEAEVLEFWPVAALVDTGARFEWTQRKDQDKPTNPAVKIDILKDGKKVSQLLLLALDPQSSIVDHDREIYGEFWFDYSDQGPLTKEERQGARVTARIDFLQGKDQKLYYRYWNRSQVVFARGIDTDGSPETAVDAFEMPAIGGRLKMYVSQFIPTDKPKVVPAKKPFAKDKLIGQRNPAAKFKLTVDDKEEEFWLFPHLNTPESPPTNRPNSPAKIAFVTSKDRVAALTMPIEAIDIGFRVRLNKFERKLDPGTEQASHYASWVDFVDHDADRALTTVKDGRPQLFPFKDLLRPAIFSADEDSVYWADERTGEIQSSQWKWSDVQPQLEAKNLRKPVALAYPYFIDRVPAGKREIGALNVVTKDGSKTLAELPYVPDALALDAENKFLYFSTRTKNAIGRLNLKTDDVDEQWFTEAIRPTHLALDATGERLLWSEAGKQRIRSVKLDGSKAMKTFLSRSDEQPLDLAVDTENKRLYFMESYENPDIDAAGMPTSKPLRWRLVSVNLKDGEDGRVECYENIDEPKGLAIVDGRPLWTQTALTRDDIWITMNAPVDSFDPQTGRSYRLFQESFFGPIKPGESMGGVRFEDLVPAHSLKKDLYQSVLTVNYDPGRGIRNVGCLLICLGIATMFYMRAYFFKPKARVVVAEAVEVRPGKKQTVRA